MTIKLGAPHLFVMTALCLLLQSGCTQVTIMKGGEVVNVERHWGILGVTVQQTAESSVIDVRGLGFVGSPLTNSIGYHRGTFASLEQDCRLIIWIEKRGDIADITHLLEENGGSALFQSPTRKHYQIRRN